MNWKNVEGRQYDISDKSYKDYLEKKKNQIIITNKVILAWF